MATWSGTTTPSEYHSFVVSEMDNSLAGPMKYPRFTAITNMVDKGSLVGVTEEKSILWTDLENLRDSKFASVADPFTDVTLPAAYSGGTTYSPGTVVLESGAYYKCTAGTTGNTPETRGTVDAYWEPHLNFVVGNSSGVFSYYGKRITSSFAEPEKGDTSVTDAMFFKDAYLSIAETGPMHLSSEHDIKQIHEIIVSFKTNSVGHLWCYAENEDGQIQGQYKGTILDKHRIKVFINSRGREFKIRLYLATSTSSPWQIQEIAIGHLIGKPYT